LPDLPDGKLYIHDAVRSQALCTEFKTGRTCKKVPIGSTNKYLMFSPDDFESLMNYIDELIRMLEYQWGETSLYSASPSMVASPEPIIPIYIDDLEFLKSKMNSRRNNLLRQL
jgi:hypothetical protein